jgi:hypothetical protein
MLTEFPKRPDIEDERRTVLLELLGVPEHAGIYVLGCFASHVTIYSQQVRALNPRTNRWAMTPDYLA